MQNLEQFKNPAQCIAVHALAFSCCLENGGIPSNILSGQFCFWVQYLPNSIKMYLKITFEPKQIVKIKYENKLLAKRSKI
jgi:hypothetical protein